jgi:hypothetical protein
MWRELYACPPLSPSPQHQLDVVCSWAVAARVAVAARRVGDCDPKLLSWATDWFIGAATSTTSADSSESTAASTGAWEANGLAGMGLLAPSASPGMGVWRLTKIYTSNEEESLSKNSTQYK